MDGSRTPLMPLAFFMSLFGTSADDTEDLFYFI